VVTGSNDPMLAHSDSAASGTPEPDPARWRRHLLSRPLLSAEQREHPLFIAVARGDLPAVLGYLAAEVPDTAALAGSVIWATVSGNTEMVGALLAAGADPNDTSDRGLSALHVAAARGNVEIAEHLLDYGADPNIRVRGKGQTPLEFGLLLSGSPDMARLLVRRGAAFPPPGPVPIGGRLRRELSRLAAEQVRR